MKIKKEASYLDTCEKYYLKPGYVYVTGEPTVIYTVLGSCVSVCLYDNRLKYGGMCHYLLPRKRKEDRATAKLGDIAIMALYQSFLEFESQPADLLAQIIGGAYLKGNDSSASIAYENVKTAKEILTKLSIKIISEDTGGELGRKVLFYSEHNELMVRKVQKIRSSDFNYYYECN